MDFISIWYGNPAGGHPALVRALEGAFAAHPVATPETATVDSSNSLTVDADATHGTLFFDLDNTNAPATITDFSTVAAELPKMHVRIAARYQQDGTLGRRAHRRPQQLRQDRGESRGPCAARKHQQQYDCVVPSLAAVPHERRLVFTCLEKPCRREIKLNAWEGIGLCSRDRRVADGGTGRREALHGLEKCG